MTANAESSSNMVRTRTGPGRDGPGELTGGVDAVELGHLEDGLADRG
jgi:hypothetical protein